MDNRSNYVGVCYACNWKVANISLFFPGSPVPILSGFESINQTNDLVLNLTPENMTQHSRID